MNTVAKIRSDAEAPEIAVVIPCFNEAPSIAKVVKDFSAAVPSATVYVFDNNSTDDTADIARDAGATVISSPLRGKGNVIRHMSSVLDADIYVLADGDDTYKAEAAPSLVEKFRREELDMLVGTRLTDFDVDAFRLFHRIGNRVISALIRGLFRTDLRDVLSGYRVLSKRFVKVAALRTTGFEIETEMTLQALTKRMRIAELPVAYGSRSEGSVSKLNTFSDGFLITKCIFLLFKDYKPLVFFSGLALLFAVGSIISGIAPIQDFIEIRYVLHVPRAILAAALGVLSLVCLTAGLILDTITRFHQENIELWKQSLKDRT